MFWYEVDNSKIFIGKIRYYDFRRWKLKICEMIIIYLDDVKLGYYFVFFSMLGKMVINFINIFVL